MKFKTQQRIYLSSLLILFSSIALMTIYQKGKIDEYRKKKELFFQWSPMQTIADFRKDISSLSLKEKEKAAAEKCFQEGTGFLKKARLTLDHKLFQKAKQSLQCADTAVSTYSSALNLGICLFYLEDFTQASVPFRRAGEIRPEASGAESFLGLSMANSGHWDKGMEHLFSALQKAQDQKDQPWESVILSNIGVIYKHLGNSNMAEKYHDKSLALCQKIKYKKGEAGELVNLAHLTVFRKEIDRPLRIFNNALAIYRKIGDERGAASTLGYIARLYVKHEDLNNAAKYYEKASALSRRIGYHQGVADTLMELGIIAYWQKKLDRSLSYYQQAEESYNLAGFAEGTSSLMGNLGILYKEKKDYPKALEYYQKALSMDRDIRYIHGEAHDLNQIGLINELSGQKEKALDAYRQSRNIFESLKLSNRIKEIDDRISNLSAPTSPF